MVRLVGEFKQVEWREQEDRVDASVGAAYAVTRLVREAVARGCIGLEFAEGIPGSVGGALVMNAGAYGSEMETVVHWVEGMTRRGWLLNFARTDLAFSYRGTRLPQEVVVTCVGFRLARGKTDELRLRVRELVGRRKGSQPAGPNAGSMFRNPPGEVAGRLIEHAGLKGTRIGQAEISRRHANFIVNLGGARAADVRKLMELARRSVERMFSIRLKTEVRIVGDWRDWSAEERDASRA